MTGEQIEDICLHLIEEYRFKLEIVDLDGHGDFEFDLKEDLHKLFIDEATYNYVKENIDKEFDDIIDDTPGDITDIDNYDIDHHPIVKNIRYNASGYRNENIDCYELSHFRLIRPLYNQDINIVSRELHSIKLRIEELYKVECIIIDDTNVYFYIIY